MLILLAFFTIDLLKKTNYNIRINIIKKGLNYVWFEQKTGRTSCRFIWCL
jgi:hypothetical protein